MNLTVYVASGAEKTRLPVRSAIYKQCTGGSVVRWVITSEPPLLYVFEVIFMEWLLGTRFDPTSLSTIERP